MAWRDAKRNKSRLFLFVSSIVLGIGALVAVYSFRDNLQRDIDEQAKMLTGADLIIDSRKPLSSKAIAILDTLGDDRSRERSFASMVYFLKSSGSRLVQVKAIEGNFPYYGTFETIPLKAGSSFQQGRGALVDKTILLQFNAKPGDSIRIGKLSFLIAGALNKAPGQSGLSSTVAPVVYIPLKYLEQTGLTKIGSRIQYKYYFRYNSPAKLEKQVKQLQLFFEVQDLDVETVESRKESTGRSFQDVSRFLALSGFIALLLGCIGVGSSTQVYIKEKLDSIATLRCLGLKASDAFLIYLFQIVTMGFIGAILGAALGTAIQFLLPVVLKDFLPVELTIEASWPSILQGIALGTLISILFALPALLAVRKISPLNAIRQSFEVVKRRFDFLMTLTVILIVLFVLAFTRLQMRNWVEALVFTGSILLACAILYCISKLLMLLVKKLVKNTFNYLFRQGFLNLYRPNNQTLMLTVAIGLSTAFICTLYFVQGILLQRVAISSAENQSNMVLFDIQSTQRNSVAELAKSFNLPVISQVPVITVRIDQINGKSILDFPPADSSRREEKRAEGPSERAFKGELRVTFQKNLTSAEKITKGVWKGKVENKVVYVSLEEGYARRINVKIGDKIIFNVQGVFITTVVGSLREVNWTRMQTNFRIVFPSGVLEEAPQFHVLMTHVPSAVVSAQFQGAVVKAFPNVSVIDLDLVLKVLEELLSKISFVIQFMAAFSMVTGWIVLVSAVLTSNGQRLKENVLLRTLGASKRQIYFITAVEYGFLGIFSAGAGILLALTGSWALAEFVFDGVFHPPVFSIIVLLVVICGVVILTGILSSRKVLNTPPLIIFNS